MQKALRYWHTLRYLKLEQITFQLLRKVRRVQPRTGPTPPVRAQSAKWTASIAGVASFEPPGRFTFLAEDGDLADIGWDGPQRPLLWRYNQHYFADLLACDAASRVDAHQSLILDWIKQNPPGQGTGWHAYPTSVRIIAWIKWALAGHELPALARESLANQARWLGRNLERHILGNHLFINAKALVFAGLWFDGPEADTWRNTGLRVLAREFPEQILPDGGHFELSPMYHILALEDVLDLVNIGRSFATGLGAQGREALQHWQGRVPDMLHWMAVMRHPDGEVAFFNDAAIGIAPAPQVVAGYADRLGLGGMPDLPVGLCDLAVSGYARAERGPAVLLTDMAEVGPAYLPGHAHADTLSFELSLAGQRFVVNGGTSVYGTSPERLRQRGTAAHATAVVNGADSSEVWSGFRVARRAGVQDRQCTERSDTVELAAAHTGYLRLSPSVCHHRTWTLTDFSLTVTDRFNGEGRHSIDLHLPIAPDWALRLDGQQVICQLGNAQTPVKITAPAQTALSLEDTTWHPAFGAALPARKIVMRSQATLPFEVQTCITWQRP